MYFGGPCRYEWQSAWSNLAFNQMRFVGAAGVMLNHTALKASAKRFAKEWLRYMIYPDGSAGELDRWQTAARERGYNYWAQSLGSYTSLANHFARIGDTELYDYVTSDGHYGTQGGPKSFLNSTTRNFQYRDHSVMRYATATASENGNAAYLIDGIETNYQRIGDVDLTCANLYYKSDYIKSHYMRTKPGLPGYPADPAGAWNGWGGEFGLLPGVLLMCGQMEGNVWPFPKPSNELSKPTNLRIVSK
jgi:hypothetical protein